MLCHEIPKERDRCGRSTISDMMHQEYRVIHVLQFFSFLVPTMNTFLSTIATIVVGWLFFSTQTNLQTICYVCPYIIVMDEF
jgi:hypothetical protein